jgi:hypothetical protein
MIAQAYRLSNGIDLIESSFPSVFLFFFINLIIKTGHQDWARITAKKLITNAKNICYRRIHKHMLT